MPWADAIYAVTYNSSGKRTGTGLGLYRIDDSLKSERLDVTDGVYAIASCITTPTNASLAVRH